MTMPLPIPPEARQGTLARAITVDGIGLHTGKRTMLRIRPAPADKGLILRRVGGGPVEDVRLFWKNYVRQYLCSGVCGRSGVPVLTVEHLLASLSVFGIDNAVIELDGSEVPILDGSARRWCAEIAAAGVARQAAARRYLRIVAAVEVRKGDCAIRIDPADTFTLHVTNVTRPFGHLAWTGAPTPATFVEQIAPSRSHGPLAAVLAKLAFAATGKPRLRGAGPHTVALTVGRHYLGGMRLPDEPVRHRTLDLIGDLALAGYPMLGRVTAIQPGHTLNGMFVRALMKRPESWRIVTFDPDAS